MVKAFSRVLHNFFVKLHKMLWLLEISSKLLLYVWFTGAEHCGISERHCKPKQVERELKILT